MTANGVLASLKDSTYRSACFAFSLAAALLDDHCTHPGVYRAVHLSVIFQNGG